MTVNFRLPVEILTDGGNSCAGIRDPGTVMETAGGDPSWCPPCSARTEVTWEGNILCSESSAFHVIKGRIFMKSKRRLKVVKYSTFIAALFTIARTWKQPKCPSTDEWIKKMGHIYTMEYYSAIKKE